MPRSCPGANHSVLALTSPLCTAGIMLFWLPRSRILHPKSRPPLPTAGRSLSGPLSFPSPGFRFPTLETLSNLGHEKQVQSLSLAASPSLPRTRTWGDRAPAHSVPLDPGVFLLPGRAELREVTPEEASHDCLIFPHDSSVLLRSQNCPLTCSVLSSWTKSHSRTTAT